MDLFDWTDQSAKPTNSGMQPLAHRMRPQNLSEWIGQDILLGEGRPLRQWITADRVPSLLIWGPPGCGKTTLAQLIAAHTQSEFVALSAVLSGVKDIKDAVSRAKETWRMSRRKTLLFVDEIHRFNKSQQDALLPHVEDGTVVLIGATTENPAYEVNSALLSRVRVVRLERHSSNDLKKVLQRALQDPERGLGGTLQLTEDAILFLIQLADGDARKALTLLESLSLFSGRSEPLSREEVETHLQSDSQRPPLLYDKTGEEHYNLTSALIKSLRDCDPDAGLYYLARMLEGGEDPLFIVRRLIIFASEDIGNADPRALMMAVAAKDAVEFVGMPEGRICLAQAVTYLAVAPKSRASYSGINLAIQEVQQTGSLPVPHHLRNSTTPTHPSMTVGIQKSFDSQINLPREVHTQQFYFPEESGLERQIKERFSRKPSVSGK